MHHVFFVFACTIDENLNFTLYGLLHMKAQSGFSEQSYNCRTSSPILLIFFKQHENCVCANAKMLPFSKNRPSPLVSAAKSLKNRLYYSTKAVPKCAHVLT